MTARDRLRPSVTARDRLLTAAFAGLVLTAGLASGLPAQEPNRDFIRVDRVVAIVGSIPIPASRIEEELNLMRREGRELPPDSAALMQLRRQILEQVINEELLLQAARRDTAISVTEQDVQAAADEGVREVRNQFTSDLEYRRELRTAGFASPEEYRRWLADQKRRELLRMQFLSRLRQTGELEPLPPTERELREAFERTRDQQPKRPAAVSLRQIVIRPEPDSAAVVEAFRKADSLAKAVRDGADFATVAKRFSEDPGTRERGGELGWVRRGMLVREFDQVAFRLKVGAVSPPVQTSFGFHIIQVQRATPAEVQVRHILIAPDISEADLESTTRKAQRVMEALRRGASFDSLARAHADPEEERLIENAPRDRLPQSYQRALDEAQPGALVGPVQLQDPTGRSKVAVILFDEARPEGSYTFEDLRDRLRGQLAEDNAIRRYLRKLRDATYVEVRL